MSTERPGYAVDVSTGKLVFVGRYQKPGYKRHATNDTKVVVDASSTQPAFFIIGGRVHTVISDLTCVLGSVGIGGLSEGSLEINTAYYLYAVFDKTKVRLIADKRDPETGPRAVGDWTYLGAFATEETTADIAEFQALNGSVYFDEAIGDEEHTGDTNYTQKTFENLPVTARVGMFELRIDGPDIGGYAALSSSDAHSAIRTGRLSVANQEVIVMACVPILTAQKVYIKTGDADDTVRATLFGWIEDPASYK